MAAATVEMAAAMFILPPVFCVSDKTGNRRESPNTDDAGNPVTIFPPVGPNQFRP